MSPYWAMGNNRSTHSITSADLQYRILSSPDEVDDTVLGIFRDPRCSAMMLVSPCKYSACADRPDDFDDWDAWYDRLAPIGCR